MSFIVICGECGSTDCYILEADHFIAINCRNCGHTGDEDDLEDTDAQQAAALH